MSPKNVPLFIILFVILLFSGVLFVGFQIVRFRRSKRFDLTSDKLQEKPYAVIDVRHIEMVPDGGGESDSYKFYTKLGLIAEAVDSRENGQSLFHIPQTIQINFSAQILKATWIFLDSATPGVSLSEIQLFENKNQIGLAKFLLKSGEAKFDLEWRSQKIVLNQFMDIGWKLGRSGLFIEKQNKIVGEVYSKSSRGILIAPFDIDDELGIFILVLLSMMNNRIAKRSLGI